MSPSKHGPQEIRALFFALVQLRRTARRHGRQSVQGLRPRPSVHQGRQRQVRGPALRSDHDSARRQLKGHGRAQGQADIGDQINKKIIAPLASANSCPTFPDFNDAAKLGTGKEMVDRLTNLVAIFENPALDFSKNRAEGDDILGDAYEYLMRHFATESGKSKGQFYARRSQPHHGEDHWHPRREDQRRHDRLRPDLRFRFAALEGGRRGRHSRHAVRAGKGRCHQRTGANEHDPAQQPDCARRAGQHAGRSQVQGRRHAQDLRLRRRQSAVLRQTGATDRSAARSLRSLPAVRHAARPGRATTPPAAHRPLAQEHGQRRVHPAARRAVSRQR